MKNKNVNSLPLYNSHNSFKLIKTGLIMLIQAFAVGIFISSILTILILTVNSAQASEAISFKNSDDVGQGSLLIETNNKDYIAVDILSTEVNISVNGLISRTQVTQVFHNTFDQTIEAIYVFPLPENASIDKFTLKVGDELIEGKIMEKKEANKVYEQAKKAGKQSAIMKQQRPNIFKTKVANIKKDAQISVSIEYQNQIDFSRTALLTPDLLTTAYELRFPLVVGPRYTPSELSNQIPNKILEEEIDLTTSFQTDSHNSSNLSNLSKHRITQSLSLIKATPNTEPLMNPVSITIQLESGFAIEQIISPSHDINIVQKNLLTSDQTPENKLNPYQITLKDKQVPANKDFILQWQLQQSDYPRASLFTEQDKNNPDSLYINMMLLPPEQLFKQEQRLSKEMILVLDTSGSMSGVSITQARLAMIKLLESMLTNDSFNIIQFNSDYESLFASAVEVNEKNIKKAINYVKNLSANGGTEMLKPLRQALTPSNTSQDSLGNKQIRQVIFMTDGNVSNETELFSLISNELGNNRLFTVGIGSAPNSYFMRKAAEFGRGSFTYIANVDEVERKMHSLFKQLESPLLTKLKISWPDEFQQVEMYPQQLSDLYLGQPLLINAKISLQANSANQHYKVLIEGQGGVTQWKNQLIVDTQANHNGVANLWGRDKISSLMDSYHSSQYSSQNSTDTEVINQKKELIKSKVIDLSLKHQIISQFTSFVAVSNKVGLHEDKSIRSINIPQHLPQGWSLNVYPGTATIGPYLQLVGGILLLISLLLYLLQIKLKKESS